MTSHHTAKINTSALPHPECVLEKYSRENLFLVHLLFLLVFITQHNRFRFQNTSLFKHLLLVFIIQHNRFRFQNTSLLVHLLFLLLLVVKHNRFFPAIILILTPLLAATGDNIGGYPVKHEHKSETRRTRLEKLLDEEEAWDFFFWN
jgi:hypothetical protein